MIKPKIILDEKINNNSNKNNSISNNNNSDNKRLSDRYNNFVALTTNYRKNNIKNYNIIRPITEVYNNNILNKFNIKNHANHNHKIKPDINKVIMNIKEQIKKLNHNITKIKH